VVESIFGRSKINFILVGSAPIDAKILDFFKIVFSCPVTEAYGMTEFAGALTYTDLNDLESGHVGKPIIACEYKLINVPELNYLVTDIDPISHLNTPRGEVLGRGNTCFSGYLCRPDETNDILDKDGWIHSGDIAVLLPGNKLKIVDRRKNIFKLCQGEYIAPEKIENILKTCPYIMQNYIFGKSTESYVVALIIVESSTLENIAKSKGFNYSSSDELISNEHIKDFIFEEIKSVCKNGGLFGFETPLKILLSYEQFTIDNGMLTVTLKTMRSNIRKVWESRLNGLYN
jgi:long-chain acyl-CoA synthetase